jgi:mono/diheme cytochrome c family protein
MAKTMARATLGSLVALAAIVAAGLALHRARFGRPMTALLLVLGFVGIGGGEFVRENLRRPFVLANLMFVNGVELPVRGLGGPSPFTIDSLERDGALAAARWVRWPEAVAAARAGQAPVRLPPPADPVLRGEALFRLQCACCHTLGGHLGIRKLVKGRDERTLQYVLSRLARPAGAGGKPADWAEPGVRLETWLGRRMPPFAGTEGERQELATYLAGLGGASPDPGLETRGSRPEERLASPVESSRPAEKSGGSGTEVMPATTATSAGAGASEPDGKALFEERCAMCHAADADWPMAARVRGRPASTFFELLGKLPEINADMEPFEGSEAERRALAAFLSGLGSDAGRLK